MAVVLVTQLLEEGPAADLSSEELREVHHFLFRQKYKSHYTTTFTINLLISF